MDIPKYIIAFLRQDALAYDLFDELPDSHKREYINWIEGAKKEETIIKRLEKMIIMLKEKK